MVEIGYKHIIAAAIVLVVIVVISVITSSPMLENSEGIVRLCNFVPAVCPEDVFAAESTVIKYFNVEPGLATKDGGSVRVQWLLVKPSSGLELDYGIYYNSSGEDPKLANFPVVHEIGYKEMTIQFNDFEPKTITISVSSEKNPEHDRMELLWEFMPDYLTSRREFLLLNLDTISNKILYQGNTNIGVPDYKIGRGLRVVGFNKDSAVGSCRWGDEVISQPEECNGETCLCLCEVSKEDCSSVERLCFGYENVDYFIGEKSTFTRYLQLGEKVNYPGIGDTRYLVLESMCNLEYWNGFSGDKSKDIVVEKLIRGGKTFIKISID